MTQSIKLFLTVWVFLVGLIGVASLVSAVSCEQSSYCSLIRVATDFVPSTVKGEMKSNEPV